MMIVSLNEQCKKKQTNNKIRSLFIINCILHLFKSLHYYTFARIKINNNSNYAMLFVNT